MLEMANKIHENINAVPTAFLGSTVCALMHKDAIQHRSGLRDEALEMNAFVNFLPLAFRHTCCLVCTVSEIPIVVIKRKETLPEREDIPETWKHKYIVCSSRNNAGGDREAEFQNPHEIPDFGNPPVAAGAVYFEIGPAHCRRCFCC